jgi:hypothetical protein
MSGHKDGFEGRIRPSDGDYNAFHEGQRALALQRARDSALMGNSSPMGAASGPSPATGGAAGGGNPRVAGAATFTLGIAMTIFGIAGLGGEFGGNKGVNQFMGSLFLGAGLICLIGGVLVWRLGRATKSFGARP